VESPASTLRMPLWHHLTSFLDCLNFLCDALAPFYACSNPYLSFNSSPISHFCGGGPAPATVHTRRPSSSGSIKQYLTGDLVFGTGYSLVYGPATRWLGRASTASSTVALVSDPPVRVSCWVVFSSCSCGLIFLCPLSSLFLAATPSPLPPARCQARRGRDADQANREAEAARWLADKAQQESKTADGHAA